MCDGRGLPGTDMWHWLAADEPPRLTIVSGYDRREWLRRHAHRVVLCLLPVVLIACDPGVDIRVVNERTTQVLVVVSTDGYPSYYMVREGRRAILVQHIGRPTGEVAVFDPVGCVLLARTPRGEMDSLLITLPAEGTPTLSSDTSRFFDDSSVASVDVPYQSGDGGCPIPN